MEATHLQSAFVCLFAILLRLAFPTTFSLLVSEWPLINADTLFISWIFPEIAISVSWFSAGSKEMAVLLQTELTLFLLCWWSAFFPPIHYFYFKKLFPPETFKQIISQPWGHWFQSMKKYGPKSINSFLSNILFFFLNCSFSCKSQYLW